MYAEENELIDLAEGRSIMSAAVARVSDGSSFLRAHTSHTSSDHKPSMCERMETRMERGCEKEEQEETRN